VDIVKLRELLEGELSSPDLTELDDDFYSEFDSLIKALKLSAESSHERGDDVEERLYLAQLTIAENLMREIIKIRLHKIVDIAVDGMPSGMKGEEKRIFAVLRAFIERDEIPISAEPEEVIPQETAVEGTEEIKKPVPTEAYIIKVALPRVMGTDLKEYGPFMEGDLAVIPFDIAKVLLERGVAERVRISP